MRFLDILIRCIEYNIFFMKAMIFAAGIGSRLKPYTDFHPKAIVPVGGVPALQRILVKLKEANITNVIVNVHHFGDQIVDFLSNNNNFGLNIKISDETGLLLDTGGGLLKVASLLEDADNEPILLHNADIITDFSVQDMKIMHEKTCADVTLLVDKRESSRQLLLSSEMELKGWHNLKTGEVQPKDCTSDNLIPMAFGGVHIISPVLFSLLKEYACSLSASSRIPFSIIPFYLWSIGRLNIKGYVPAGDYRWFDIGTPEKLAAADLAFG